MTATTAPSEPARALGEYVTFHVGDLLMGIATEAVDEINRPSDLTPVPHAPPQVRGVVNLRGEVVTLVDLRAVLGLGEVAMTNSTRSVIVRSGTERVGLVVDRIADVVRPEAAQFEAAPANVGGVDERFFDGVCKLDDRLMIVLDVEHALHLDVVSESRSPEAG